MPVLDFCAGTALDVFRALSDAPGVVFLDSAAMGDPRSRYSYVCAEPVATLTLRPDQNPFPILKSWLATHLPRIVRPPDCPVPFAGGAIGWLGYEAGHPVLGTASRFTDREMPLGWFGLYDSVLAFDHATGRAFLILPDKEAEARPARWRACPAAAPPAPARNILPDWQPGLSREDYVARIETLRAYIAAGDIYQANFTTRFSAPRPPGLSLPSLYAALRTKSPAPFAAYLAGPDGHTILGASPERFLRLDAAGRVETRPIKGTAPRFADSARDGESARRLAESPKERAENLMITDLLRNDLGQVCAFGSIAVPQLCAVESYAQAHHLVSAVTGTLRPGLGPADLLAACFPGGSITGAPKRRAVQIIDALEAGPRGPYCGTIAWIGADGAMDSAIIIRSLIATDDTLHAQAGGGITWDSDAEAEYEEMMLKIFPLLTARG